MPRVNGLTPKEKKFVNKYVLTQKPREAALAAYDITDRGAAGSIAFENLKKPRIQEEIKERMRKYGLDEDFIATNLRKAIEAGIGQKATNADSLRGVENLIKIYDPITKSARLNINVTDKYSNVEFKDLIKELREQSELTQKLLKEVGGSGT